MRKGQYDFSSCLLVLTLLGSLIPLQGQERFRPESEREQMREKSAYEKWIEQEGIPIYRGQAIASVFQLPLGPWKRMGVQGAFVVLDGTQGMIDAVVFEIPAGKGTQPEKHFFEENSLILSGSGKTEIWLEKDGERKTVYWRNGSVFSPPLNTWHQHFNTGEEPVRIISVTNAPFLMDFFHDSELLFNVEARIKSRYTGDPNYFDPEIARNYAPYKGKHSLSIVNIIRDVREARLSIAGQGYGDVDRHYVLSQNRMGTHIESFPVGTYERGHRHGPGASIIFLTGTGYSLYWPAELGTRPFSEGKGDQVQRVDWQNGTMYVPANQWFHQHFNTGKEPARFIKLGSPNGPGGRNVVYKMLASMDRQGGSLMIKFRDEDPEIRRMFEEDLKRTGAPLNMPSVEELVALEKEADETSGGMLQQVVVDR